MEETIKDI